MADRLNQAQLARALEVSRVAVHKLVKAGKLVLGEDGKIDLETARAAIANSVHPGSKTAQAVSAAGGGAPADPQTVVIPSVATQFLGKADEHGMPTNFHVARTLREAAEARMAQIELAKMTGELVSLSDRTKAAREIGRQVRDALEVSRRRLSPYLAAAQTVAECEEIQRKEHQVLLQNLVTSLGKIAPVEGVQA